MAIENHNIGNRFVTKEKTISVTVHLQRIYLWDCLKVFTAGSFGQFLTKIHKKICTAFVVKCENFELVHLYFTMTINQLINCQFIQIICFFLSLEHFLDNAHDITFTKIGQN